MKRINKQGGFTLLELLVVVAIIAIIAGAVISAISGQEERAGQGVALHTMGALENATRQTVVLKGGLPSGLDSLICKDLSSFNPDTNDSSDLADVDALLPTLASGLSGKLTVITLPASSQGDCSDDDGVDGACMLTESGITSLRYAETVACDNDEATTATVDGVSDVGDEAANEVLANTLFWDVDSGGAGIDVSLDANNGGVEIAVLTEPTDIGQEPGTVVGVFGVGNFSEMSTSETAKTLSRGPVDGNVDGDGERYSHFSLAIKLAETEIDGNIPTLTSAAYEADEVEIVAILDSDGDGFDDEVAEFAGLEDE